MRRCVSFEKQMKTLFSILIITSSIYSQNIFVKTSGNKFTLNNDELKFIGFNAYYLQSEAGDTARRYIADDAFESAKNIGVNVIRTWAFYESSSFSNPSVIRKSPYEIQESGLVALDYVLQKARENRIFIILTLSNNYSAFGGIPQYIKWANQIMLNGSGNHTHNDFFVNDSLKQWFKFYIESLLNRTNTFSGIKYKDDPNIFSWEIINEAENPGMDFNIIKNWYEEISSFIRSIDQNHLITTGENGYDVFPDLYSDIDLMYNGSHFLVNGHKGTSYYENSQLNDIDYVSFHSYPNGWGLSAKAGKTWIKDHYKIAETFNKPCLLGEFGIKENKLSVYSDWLDDIKRSSTKSAIVWQYLHPDVVNNDGYGFNEFNSPELMELFQNYIKEINSDTVIITPIPKNVILYQNYPNPFNPVTSIKYSLPQGDYVSLEIYTTLGELVGVVDKEYKQKGEYEIILSFDNILLSSGVYFYTLRTSSQTVTKKLMLLK
jgi:mannan endo-1,4-beta-mannosidase